MTDHATHQALKKIGEWLGPPFQNEGGNYVLTRNDKDYLAAYWESILVQDALAFIAATGTLGTIGSANDPVPGTQGYNLDGVTVTAKFSLNLDTASSTLTWNVTNQPQQTSTFTVKLYRENTALNSMAFYAESASDGAAYSLNILLL